MSDPISILGTALAVASVAANLSIKLFEIGKTIKNAPREVASIASELSMASSILCNVRDTLNRGSYLIKPHLIADMRMVLCKFGEVNSEISIMIDKSGNKKKKKKKKRLSLAALMVFKEHQVKDLMAKVESLKLSMNIIMNTVILAATLDTWGREEKKGNEQEEHTRVIRMIVHSGVESSRREIDKQQRSEKEQKTRAKKTDLQLRDHGNTASWLHQLVFSPESRGIASEENTNAIQEAPASEQETEKHDALGTLSINSANRLRKEDADMTSTGQKLMQPPENPEVAIMVDNESKMRSQKDLSRAQGNSFVYKETPEVVERLLYVWTYSQERREKASHERRIHASPHGQQGKAIENHQNRFKRRMQSGHSLSAATGPSSAEQPSGSTRRHLPPSRGSEYNSDDEYSSTATNHRHNSSQTRHSRSRRAPTVSMENSPMPSPDSTRRGGLPRMNVVKSIHSSGRSDYHSASGDDYIGTGAPHSDSESEDSAGEEFWISVDDDDTDAPKRANSTSPPYFTARGSSSRAYHGTKTQPKIFYEKARRKSRTSSPPPSPQPPPQPVPPVVVPPPPPPPPAPREPTLAELEAMEQAAEQSERLKKLEELLMQQAQARADKQAAKKKAAEDAATTEAEAKKKVEEDKSAKLHDLLIAQREEQKARDEAIAAARAAEKAEVDATAAKYEAEKQKAAEDTAKLLAAAKKVKDEAEAKAAEDAKAAKEAHEKALAEAAEELRQMKEEVERKAGAKVRPDFLSKLSRKWSSKGKGGA